MDWQQWRRVTGAALAALLIAGVSHARAQSRILAVGDLRLAYDAARWTPVPARGSFVLNPANALERTYNPVLVRALPAASEAACEQLAAAELANGPYADARRGPIFVVGRRGIRLEAQTRCRNATPRGFAACVAHGGRAYVFASTIRSCRSGATALFSMADPLAELLEHAAFEAP